MVPGGAMRRPNAATAMLIVGPVPALPSQHHRNAVPGFRSAPSGFVTALLCIRDTCIVEKIALK
jgi:hypothetical protein